MLARVAADPARRTAFASALARFCAENSLALVDFDWEYPRTRREEADYGSLVAEVKQRVGRSVAVSLCVGGAEMHGRPHVDETAVRAADRIHLMAYLPPADQRTARMAYLEKHVRYWLDVRRLPREKLFVGIGFFGRHGGPVAAQRPRSLAYRKIYDAYHPLPGHEEAAGYWFNGVDTVTRQVELAWRLGLGGVFVWECSQDVTLDKPAGASLQATIARTIRRLRRAAPHAGTP
jgi:GH18 family chitinase